MSFPKKIVHVVAHGAFLEKNPDKKTPHGQLLADSLGAQDQLAEQLRLNLGQAGQLPPQQAAALRRRALEIRALPRQQNNNTEAVAPWKLVESNDQNDTKKYQDDYKFHYNTEPESAMQQLWNKFKNMHSTSEIPDQINIPVIETTTPGSAASVPTHGFDLNLIKSLKDFLVAKNHDHGDLCGNNRKIMGSRSNIPDGMIEAIIGHTSEERINVSNSLKRKNNIVDQFGNNQFSEEEKEYYRDNNNILGYPYDIRMFFPQNFNTRVFNQRDEPLPAERYNPTRNTDPDAEAEYLADPPLSAREQSHAPDPTAMWRRYPPPMDFIQQGPNWTHGRAISIISGPRPEIEKTQKRIAENAERGDHYRTEVQKGGLVITLGARAAENNFYTKGNSKEYPGKPDYISKDGTKKISLSDYSQRGRSEFQFELKPNALNWGIHELDFNKIEIDMQNTSPPPGITEIIALLRETIPINETVLDELLVPAPADQADYLETVQNILKKVIHDSFENLRPVNPVNQHERRQANEKIKTAIILGQFSRREPMPDDFIGSAITWTYGLGKNLWWYLNGGPDAFGRNTYESQDLRNWYQNNIEPNLAREPLIKNNFNIADYIELSLTLNTQIKNNGKFESIDNQNFLAHLFGRMDTNNTVPGMGNVLQRIIDKLIELEYLEDILLNTVNNTLRNFRENQYIISDKLEHSDEQTINNIPLSNWFVHIGEGNNDLRSIRDTRDCLDRWNQFTEAELNRIKQNNNNRVLIHESFSEYKPPQEELEYLHRNRLINKTGYIDDFTYEARYDQESNFIKKGKYKIASGRRRNSSRYDIDSRFLSIKFRTGEPRPDIEAKNVTPERLGTEYKFVKGAFVVWLNGTGDTTEAEMGVLMENANSCGVPGTREVKVRKCSNHETINKPLDQLYARLYNPDGGIMFLERTQLKTNVNLYSPSEYTGPQNPGDNGTLTWTKDKYKSLKAGTSFYTFVPNSFQILDYYVNVERTWPIISSNVCRDPAHTTPYYLTSLAETPIGEQEGSNCYNDLWRETSYGVMEVHPPLPSPLAQAERRATGLGPSRNPVIPNQDLNNNLYCKKEVTITQNTPESFKSEMYKKFPVTQLYIATNAAKNRVYWRDKAPRNVSVDGGIAAGDRVSRISQDNRERILGSQYIGEMTLDQRNAEDFREAEPRD